MSDKLIHISIAIAIIAILAAIFCIPYAENKGNERTKAYRESILGHPFTLNGKTYVGIHLSNWDGTVQCISDNTTEIWVDGAVILNALKVKP